MARTERQTDQRTDQGRIPIALIVVAVLLLIARFTYSPPEKEKGAIDWVSPEAGAVLARDSGKPLLLFFTAEWCGPCHMLEDQVFAEAAIAARINERFVAIRITDRVQEEGKNTPQVAELKSRYAIRGFPTVVFTDGGGAEQARMEGFKGRDEFVRVMEHVR